MENKIKLIINYAEQLKKDNGWDIIINDRYGILGAEITKDGRGIIGGWRNNPYCLTIKSNHRLWNRCVALKAVRDKKLKENGRLYKTTCYCGVTEYTVPVIVGGLLVATVSATGFFAPLTENMQNILSRRVGVTALEFCARRSCLLNEADDTVQKLWIYLKVLAEMISEVADNSPVLKGSVNFSEDEGDYVRKAIDYINDNYMFPITAADVAEYCHLSLSYLQHLFAKHKSKGIFKEITARRMSLACYMLKNTNCSVKEIAIKCGFQNVDYFSVAFKKQCGTTPLKYRRLQ